MYTKMSSVHGSSVLTVNTSGEFIVRRKLLVFGLNNYPIPPKQMYKKKKRELAFAIFRSEVLVLILSPLMSAIFEVVGRLYSFCEFSGKQK